MNDRLLGLLIEFDEMGFAPTTVCEDAEGYAKTWKEQLVREIKSLEVKNTDLWHKAEENSTNATMQKNRADFLKKINTDLHKELAEYKIRFKKVYMDFFSKLNLDKDFRKKFNNVTLGCQIKMFEDELDRADKDCAELKNGENETQHTSKFMDGEIVKAKEGSVLACPFCGSKDIYYRQYQHAAGERFAVFCAGCMAEIDNGCAQNMGQARRVWNRRQKDEVKAVAERIKMAFYYEFDELIPSTMADKIDEIVKEVLNEHEL